MPVADVFALFYPGRALKARGILSRSLGDVDRELLVAATEATLENEDGRVRDAAGNAYGMLTDAEIEAMLPSVYRAVVKQAPSGVMFSDGIRLRGLELLAEHRIAEGLPLCVSLIELDRWSADRRFERCLRVLKAQVPEQLILIVAELVFPLGHCHSSCFGVSSRLSAA